MKIKKRVIIAILITIFALISSWNSWLVFKPFPVEITYKTKNSGDIIATLNRKNNNSFAKVKKCQKTIQHKDLRVEKFEVQNAIFPRRFRLELLNLKTFDKITVKEITLNGNKVDISDIKNFSAQGAKIEIKNNNLIIYPQIFDCRIVYSKTLNIFAPCDFDIHLFIIILILSYLLAYKLTDYIADFSSIKKKTRVDLIYLVAFFLTLSIPMLNIDQSEISKKENRTLAKWKPLFNDGKLNYTFGKDFDAWFSDRFFQRDDYINMYYNQFVISKNLRTKKVVKGKDNWLFHGTPDAINMYTRKNNFQEKELKLIADYLSGLNNYYKKRNQKFYFMIAPSKSMIYPEFYSEVITPEKSETLAHNLIDYLKKHTDVKVIYPEQRLLKNKEKNRLYYKTDTHWNEMGAYYGYEEIVDVLSKDMKLKKFNFTKMDEKEDIFGDLNNSLPKIIQLKQFEKYNRPLMPKGTYSCLDTASAFDVQSCESKNGNLQLVMFRDSFTINMLPYIASTFKKSKYYWQGNVDTKFTSNADVVIYEIVEVSLPKLVELKFKETK